MKKIITITFHQADNYGALLQAYALQNVLIKNYETLILNYDNKNVYATYRPYLIRKNDSLFYYILRNFKYLLFLNREIKRSKKYKEFRQKYLMITKKYYSKDLIDADAIITGSDQVWNPQITNQLDDIYFLNLKTKAKKISYAVSCGEINNISEKKDIFLDKIKKIDKLSVREKQLKEFISSNSDLNVDLVLDPTFLITKKEWLDTFVQKPLINGKYIFVYIMGKEDKKFYNAVNTYSRKNKTKIIYFNQNDIMYHYKYKKENWYKANPKEFLNILYYSDMVFTNSYHGLAMSIILNKNMIISLSANPNRLLNIINIFNINSRVLSSDNSINLVLSNEIDWNSINNIIEIERKKSINWLYNAIEN